MGAVSPETSRGRRGRRRVVAPATSGQPEEVEAQTFTSASLEAESSRAEEAEVSEEGPGEKASGTTSGKDSAGAPPLSARDRWILEQRPPHWD